MMIYDMVSMISQRGILIYIIWWFLYDDVTWEMILQWWLRSIMSSYGRTCDRDRIWGDYNSLHRGCLRDISSKRVVGVSSWCITYVRHIRVNTSVGTVYDIFLFSWFKNLYVLCFKIYMYYKRNMVVSNFVLAWRCSKKVFNHP